NEFDQFCGRAWFLAEENIHTGVFLLRFSQPTDNDHGDLGIYFADKADKIRPGRFRHDVICNDYADLLSIRKTANQGKSAVGTGSYLYLQSGLAQHGLPSRKLNWIVIYQENSFAQRALTLSQCSEVKD